MTAATRSTTEVDATFQPLHERIIEAMERLHVPGVAVGVIHDGAEHVAAFGVTNVDYPAPVIEDTLFQIGSTTKTLTATVALRLVDMGKLDLDAPVRAYLPDLRLADETTAAGVTTRHLLTHTGGWSGDHFLDTGRGEDALAAYVASLAGLPQLTPLGEVWSYNNAAFSLVGRVIEAITGKPYETTVRELALDPLGMRHSFYFPEEVMMHSFVVGHNVVDDTPQVATPWNLARSANPAGGLTSSAGDQLRYARFHMGDGTTDDGTRVLSRESIALMQTPGVQAADDERMGLAWFIRDSGGVRTVRHGGATNGQISTFMFAPARGFALTILTNANRGGELTEEVAKWALEHYVGIVEPTPTPLEWTEEQLAPYAGRYAAALTVADLVVRDGSLVLELSYSDFPADEPPPAPPPARVALYAEDRIIVLDGPLKDARGEILRRTDGSIAWLRIGGRVHRREA
jgi:CubicO group peptidase (beta-lactamase class C family)